MFGSETELTSQEHGGIEEFDYKKYVCLVRDNILLFILVGALSFTAITVYFSQKAPVYRAECNLMIERSNPSGVLFKEFSQNPSDASSQVDVITSDQVLGRAVEKIGLKERFPKSTEALAFLRKSIEVRAKSNWSNVVTISVLDTDPVLAAKIANSITQAYIDYDKEQKGYLPKFLESREIAREKGAEEEGELDFADSLPSVVGDQFLQELKKRKIELEQKVHEMSRLYRDKYPPLAYLKKSLIDINGQIKKRTKDIVAGLKIGIEQQMTAGKISVLNPATPPEKPDRRKQIKITVLAVLCPLMILFGFLVFKEESDKTIKTEDDLAGLPFFGYVPADRCILKSKELSDETREIFNLIKTNIAMDPKGQSLKSILITSMYPGEGKTTLSVNLALSLARSNTKTLLFFADLRRPRFSNFFQLDPSRPTFGDYLQGKNGLHEIINESVAPNLDVIIPGAPMSRSELMTPEKLEELMKFLRTKYEKILIDSPPLMVGISDTLLLSRATDGIMVVTSFGKTKSKIFHRGVHRLREIGVPIFGVVINKVDTRRGHYSYYQDYYLPYKPYRHHPEKGKKHSKSSK